MFSPVVNKLVAVAIVIVIFPLLLLLIGNLLPADLPPEVAGAVETITDEIYKWDFLLPVNAFFTIISLSLLLEIAIFGLNMFLMIWSWFKKAE